MVASYNCVEFEAKLIKQTLENGKETSFRPDFESFGPNLGPKIFFGNFTSARC